MDRALKLLQKGFASSSSKTPEFKHFARIFKNEVTKAMLPWKVKITKFLTGHFYVSGFIRDERDNCYYFSISDVRFFHEPRILFRIAKDENDYTGGRNHYLNYSDVGIGETPCPNFY